MMILISTTTDLEKELIDCINTIDRLSELVQVSTGVKHRRDVRSIFVKNKKILVGLDWQDDSPPIVLPEVAYSSKNLLAVIFYLLGNHQKAFEYLEENDPLHAPILLAAQIQYGYTINSKNLERASDHNIAIAYNFGNFDSPVDKQKVQDAYEVSISKAGDDGQALFTVKHYVNFLMDAGMNKDAEKLIRQVLPKAQSEEAKNTMRVGLSRAMLAQVQVPYEEEILGEILELLLTTIQFYESNNLTVNAGLQLINASEVANYQKNMTFSKELIEKAIVYFRDANIPEFLGEAVFQKAILLYTWSKNGIPGFYKPSINAFQDALKVFKRDTHPQKYAEVQHNLALLYSEVPVSSQEKPIWTAFCASAFKEALNFFTKENHPYEFAMVSHNYASAMMNFPDAKLSNNITKAFGLFEDALSIRTAERYPFERALTLLNQLEFYWLLHNDNAEDENKNINDMIAKANEIKSLSDNKDLLEKANKHLSEIENLKQLIK